jgi:acyl carrier protein
VERGTTTLSRPEREHRKPETTRDDQTMSDVLSRLNQVFQDVFDDDELTINPETAAPDVEGWDSLMHVTLVVNVEKAFGVRFSSSEVAALKNVGELVDLIARHQGGGESVVRA